jgi:hypothetical protein
MSESNGVGRGSEAMLTAPDSLYLSVWTEMRIPVVLPCSTDALPNNDGRKRLEPFVGLALSCRPRETVTSDAGGCSD